MTQLHELRLSLFANYFSWQARNKEEGDIKKIAYLLDSHTVRVIDLSSGQVTIQPGSLILFFFLFSIVQPVATINHDSKIDWLELNPRASW